MYLFSNHFKGLTRPAALSSLLLASPLLVPCHLAAQSSITVQAQPPGPKASPNLYGIFVEDWCHQVEGGIYAEMIRNRSFDDATSAKEVLVAGFVMRLQEKEQADGGKAKEIPAWKLVNSQPGAAEWSIDSSHPLNENNPRCLKLQVAKPSPQTGIYNEGHCLNVLGVAVTKGSEYRFSCYARSETPGAALEARLESPEGKVMASQKLSGISREWKKFEMALTPNDSLTGARLFLAPITAGTYYLDMVSLFPKETWKGRPNGLRKDIMEWVAAMKPSFVRFPGGCFVEGLELENAWHWKKTLGDVAQRPGHWNIWGWRSSDGMGYHEYLQMCEDLGAEPLHVVNDGISHTTKDGVQQDGVYVYQPMEKMQELVQDALDSIEYANGPVTSTWGAMRAAAGHPAPFNLKYIEVGNENFGPEYDKRYPLFHDAIKAKYPNITVLMDTWGPNTYSRNRVPDMRDIHRFTTPYQFALNYHQFDKYDRKEPKVYFGEWCVELELPHKDSLETGLYEGVFLTGLEKNSDHVLMSSYAPFMNNIGWQNRKPNMISFDLDHVYGAPIYWIQRMYSERRIDSLLNFTAESPEYRPIKSGQVGVGSQNTEVEYKDFKISKGNEVLFDANTVPAGQWQDGRKGHKADKPADGVISLPGDGTPRLMTKKEFGGDYTITVKARKLGGKNGFQLYFNTKNCWQVGGDGNKASKIIAEELSKPQIVKQSIEENRWYDLKVELKGDDVRCYLDNALVNEGRYSALKTLYVSAGRNGSEIILKVINITSKAQQTRLAINAASLEPVAKATVLTSTDPLAKNSRENPLNVIPKTVEIQNVSPDFQYEFPAYSATVLQLKEKNRN